MNDPKRKFKGMLARIFSDGRAEESERTELSAFVASGALSPSEIKDVIDDFVRTTWKITMADGVVSEVERTRLRAIVEVLALSPAELPEAWAAALQS